MTKTEAKKRVAELVEKYEQVKESGAIKQYSEEDTKKGFLVPLFQALGWDFENRDEVSSEEHVKSSGFIDYGFYLGGRAKFYLEAKKLAADLHGEEFAKQAIRYSWNKGVTWAVLTDFESLKVFYAQSVSQHLGDKLYFEIRVDKYLEQFDELWRLSKDAFTENILDDEAERAGKKYQKISVTETLYKDLNESRGLLLKSFRTWNSEVPDDLLEEGVQKLLDRLIFIRVAEDRGLEDKTLLPMLRVHGGSSSEKFFQNLVKKFRELDNIYNSNLFAPHPFEQWQEYDGATERAINTLHGSQGYYDYDFKIIPADILGSVYENYLGYKLAQSDKGVAVTQDSRKRKEQGIYYTPTYIVDYIVTNTLKPVLDKCRSIQDLKAIKVLDPACGSGSFLIRAAEMIYDKYLEFGANPGEMTKITILLDNIFGVDLDEQAVEIARLNLLINALDTRMKLPLLDNNIKNGNSLISGTDAELEKTFGKNFRDKKPFNWTEEFPQIFTRQNSGFDVIVGNPPYIKEYVHRDAFNGLRDSPYYQGKMDIWTIFGCQAIDMLREKGSLGFIAPNNWVTNAGASIFRDKVLTDGELVSFIDFGDYKIFDKAGIQTMIFIFKKTKSRTSYDISYARAEQSLLKNPLDIFDKMAQVTIKPQQLIGESISFSNGFVYDLLKKIKDKQNFELHDSEIAQGIVGDPDKAFIFTDEADYTVEEMRLMHPYFTSVGRYSPGDQRGQIAYLSKQVTTLDYLPNIDAQLSNFKDNLNARREVLNNRIRYFHLHWPRDERFFKVGPKIVCAIRTKRPQFFYTENAYYGSRALNIVKTERINLKFLTGLFNSMLVAFWLKHKGKSLGDLLQVDNGPLLKIPIFLPPSEDQIKVTEIVEKITNLKRNQANVAENSDIWHSLKSETEKIDSQIDQLIYRIYKLTPEEIELVENSSST